MQAQSWLEIEAVAHSERAEENVELPPTPEIVEEKPAFAMHRIEALVSAIPIALEKVRQSTSLTSRNHKVEIAIFARQRTLN